MLIPRAACSPSLRARKLCDFHGHRMHYHVASEFFAKGTPPLAVRTPLSSVDTVGQFDDGYNRERGVNFPEGSLNSLERLPHTLRTSLPGDELSWFSLKWRSDVLR